MPTHTTVSLMNVLLGSSCCCCRHRRRKQRRRKWTMTTTSTDLPLGFVIAAAMMQQQRRRVQILSVCAQVQYGHCGAEAQRKPRQGWWWSLLLLLLPTILLLLRMQMGWQQQTQSMHCHRCRLRCCRSRSRCGSSTRLDCCMQSSCTQTQQTRVQKTLQTLLLNHHRQRRRQRQTTTVRITTLTPTGSPHSTRVVQGMHRRRRRSPSVRTVAGRSRVLLACVCRTWRR